MKASKPTTVAAATQPAKTVMDDKTEKKPVGSSAGFFCYVGPSVVGLIRHGAIFMGDKKAALKAAAPAIEKIPQVKNLIVPAEELPTARLKVKTPGTSLYSIARRITGNR